MFSNFTVLSWVLLLIAFLCLLLAGAALKVRHQAVTVWFVCLLLAYAIEAFGYAFELASDDLASVLFWLNLEFVGAVFIPSCALLFAISYQTRKSPPHWLSATLLIISSLVLVAQLTNEWHGQGFSIIGLSEVNGLTITTNKIGMIYWAYSLYIHFSVICSIIIFIRCMQNAHPVLRPQILFILVGITLTWLNYTWTLFGNTPYGLDMSAFGFSFCIVAFSISVFRYGFIKISPIARDQIFHQVEHGYIVLDDELRVIDYNPKAQNLFPTLDQSVIGQSIYTLFEPDLLDLNGVHVLRLGDARLQVQRCLIGENEAMAIGSVVTLYDVTEKEQLLEEMEKMANTDSLTGSLNRHALEQQLRQLIIESRRRVSPVTVLALDVIKFRKINDIHGYTIGDMRLKQLCHLLINQLPQEALLGRYVGDIFLVILPNMKIENALQLAKDVEMKAQSLISLSLHTSCLQHVSEESERQLIDRLFATLRKQKSLLTSI